MATARKCAGGCGKEIPSGNKSGYAWGHKNGCPQVEAAGGGQSEEAEEQPDYAQVDMTGPMLDKVWGTLTLGEKAVALEAALAAE